MIVNPSQAVDLARVLGLSLIHISLNFEYGFSLSETESVVKTEIAMFPIKREFLHFAV